MRRSPSSPKLAVTRVSVRKSAASVTAPVSLSRRVFPAWIDDTERSVAPVPAVVTSRVRDGLVLRVVAQKKPAHPRSSAHGAGR